MDKGRIDLSISIVNTNNRDILQSCLKSIYKSVEETIFEIIVVDNCSTDGSVEMIKKHFPNIKIVLVNPRNGYGFCHNRAFEESRGRYFLVLNEDMIILPHAIDIIVDNIKKDKTIGALGCKLLNPDRTLQNSCFRFPTLITIIYESIFPYTIFSESSMRREIAGWNHDSERDVDVIMGSCMLIPREVIEKIGLFDERFFLYSDEVDLCKRLKNERLKVHFTPKAQIIHYCAYSTKVIPERSYVIYLESRCKYFKKHYGDLQAWVIKMCILLGITLRFVGWWVVKTFRLKHWKIAEAKLRNYRKGFLWFFGLYKS